MFQLPPASGEEEIDTDAGPTTGQRLQIDLLSEEQLLELRAEIDQLLPTKALTDLNMERELVLQLTTVQHLQMAVLRDKSVPANQKAQTVNSVAASLQALAKLQTEVYTSERLKTLEHILIKTLQTLPTAAQEEFLQAYEGAIAKAL